MSDIDELIPDGERLMPGQGRQIACEHLHRYGVAMGLAAGKRVLDIACGEGYGSRLLATVATEVVGVDIAPRVVEHAREKYSAEKLRFLVGSCLAIPADDASFDLVVSFETIEHIAEHDRFLDEIKRVLRPGGRLLLSSPDKRVYSDQAGFANPHHVRELTEEELGVLLRARFPHVRMAKQLHQTGSVILAPGAEELVAWSGDFSACTRSAFGDEAVYCIALAGDEPLPPLPSSCFRLQSGAEEPEPLLMVQLFASPTTEFTAERSETRYCRTGSRTIIRFEDLPQSLPAGTPLNLRLDPAERLALVTLHQAMLQVRDETGQWSDAGAMTFLRHSAQVVSLDPDASDFLCLDADPQLFFAPFTPPETGAWRLQVELTAECCPTLLAARAQQALRGLAGGEGKNARERDAMALALDHRSRAEQQPASLRAELLAREETHRHALAAERRTLALREAEIATLRRNAQAHEAQNLALTHELRDLRHTLSWRLTAPFRVLADLRAIISSKPSISGCTFHIETGLEAAGLRLEDNPLRIAGWFFDTNGARATLIRVRVGARRVPCIAVERPDVVAYFDKRNRRLNDAHIGFFTEFKTGPGLKVIVVEAVCAGGGGVPLRRRVRWMRPYRPVSASLPMPGDDDIIATARDTADAPAPDVRAIAFYLPQFHRIPENDQWWGEGFTEWTNVRPAKPWFEGHHQPHVPHPDVGHYDLNDPEVLEKQARLARSAGIYGFCFYYYWFGGKRLLEMPLERMLATGKPDFPFCYCWANENWSRRWDGQDAEVLIAQKHSPEDNEAVIRDLCRAFRDPRYIRVENRPLLLIYRPLLLPDARATFARWREVCRAEGIGEIHLAGVRGFSCSDAAALGLDALVEFPPGDSGVTDLTTPPETLAPEFTGKLYDYREARRNHLRSAAGGSPLYRGVIPSWDNTARRKAGATIFTGSSPGAYLAWLRSVIALTRETAAPEHRLIFINAWNEWAEGCHLEPDTLHGYAWLNATRRALGSWPEPAALTAPRERPLVLLIGHDAALGGAQIVLLAILRAWQSAPPPFDYRLVLERGGALRAEFEKVACTFVCSDFPGAADRHAGLARFASPAPSAILANTVTVGPLLDELSQLGAPVVTFCHELQKSIERYAPGPVMAATLRRSTSFLAASNGVATNLRARHGVPADRVRVLHAAIELWDDSRRPSRDELEALRAETKVGPDDLLVVGAGTTDWRKGADLFIQIAARASAQEPRLRFVWIGGELDYAQAERSRLGLSERVRFLGPRPDARRCIHAANLFALSSREDPCPLVALEAAEAGLPVICFAGAGDIPDVLGGDAGAVVAFEDVTAFADALVLLSRDDERRRRAGAFGKTRVIAGHDIRTVAAGVSESLTRHFQPRPPPLVSVIVPNYNHARFLTRRLESVAGQTLRNTEIILLDDASSDHSRDVLHRFAAAEPRARYLPNAVNSGSTFKQWRKGLREARGKYVWIAESDDAAEPELLERLVARLEADPKTAVACCQLRMMDLDGKLGGTPDEWLRELHPTRWSAPFTNDGRDEIARFLSRKNTILNASGVVFRRFDDIHELVDDSMRLCADWLFWVRLLARGKIAHDPAPLNYWRLQSSNARTRPPGELEWEEGQRVIREIADLLGSTDAERETMLRDFAARCDSWRRAQAASIP